MEHKYSKAQISWLVALRIVIGWHFLYEGLTKVLNPSWTARPYLLDSKGPFESMFVNIAGNQGLMSFVDFANEWALVLIGTGLLIGLFARLAGAGGILLLVLYTMSHPALTGVNYQMPFEGSYFLIDKNIVELAALGLLYAFPSARIIGIDRYLIKILPESFTRFIL